MHKLAPVISSLILLSLGFVLSNVTARAQQADAAALEIINKLSLREADEAIRNHHRWAPPEKIAVAFRATRYQSEESFLAGIRSVAGDADVVLYDPSDTGAAPISDADVLLGFCRPALVRRLTELRWIHSYSVGVDRCLGDPGVRDLDFIMTNNQRLSAPSISEVAIGMAIMLAKNLHRYQTAQSERRWVRDRALVTRDLSGRTMLILGLGGIGTETARRASALGMRVIATRNSSRDGPDFVEKVGLSHEMYELAAEADFAVNALPLTDQTNGLIDRKFFDALKEGAYYINVGRGKTTVTADLISALNEGTLGGAGLDVMDPEPLPPEHPLWKADNVIITPHVSGRNIDAYQRSLIIAKENLRRYVRGEKLLSVVDVERGY
jgi:phosphoglycerate dehydrogenase-like enzyme